MVGLVVVVVERNSFFRSAVALTSLSFALASFGWLAGTASKLVSKTRKSRGVRGGGVGLVWRSGVGGPSDDGAFSSERVKRSVT